MEKSGENADEYVVVRQIGIPSLGNVMQLAKEDAFSLFIPKHQEYAAELLEIFLGNTFFTLIYTDEITPILNRSDV